MDGIREDDVALRSGRLARLAALRGQPLARDVADAITRHVFVPEAPLEAYGLGAV